MLCQYSRTAQPQALITTRISLPLLFASSAWAAPLSDLAKRGVNGGSGAIVAPVIVVVVFLIAVPVLFYRKSIFPKLRNITFYSVLAPHQAPTAVRNLTAEEIAGTTATAQAQAATAARTERRARRNRRTPSQISTRSLPAYMKEPGELELVIIQGSQDMEDAPLTTQVVMPPVTEDEDESAHSHSRNISQTSSYVIIDEDDDPHAQTPLLETDQSNEATHERESSNAHVSPGTLDISDVRDSDDLTPSSPEPTDPRGEAPPYFEVVGDLEAVRATSGELTRVETTDTLPIAPDTSRVSDEQPAEFAMSAGGTITGRRRSMFRGLINAASRALSSPQTHPQSPTGPRPSRDMVASPRPSNLSARPAGTRSSQVGHRATPSNSGSVLSVTSSAFGRVTSRSRSTSNVAAGLTSPSMISIGSISSPLTHTAVRTDFVYPRSGPTPEQLKLISSIESVSKFGVPYGPAAVAYASASRVGLQPPPDFEERPSLDGLPGPSEAGNRARSRSALGRRSQEETFPDSRSSGSSPPPPAEFTAAPQPMSSSEPVMAMSSPDPDASDDTKERDLMDPVEIAPPRPPSPSPTVATASTAATVTKATIFSVLGAVTETSDDPVASNSHRPALPSFDAAAVTAAPTIRKPIAPSSFRMPSAPLGGVRPGSRASSVDTFRTAASRPEQGQQGDEIGMSDTELETDAFTDAEGGAETESETPPATPHAAPAVDGGMALGPESHALSV